MPVDQVIAEHATAATSGGAGAALYALVMYALKRMTGRGDPAEGKFAKLDARVATVETNVTLLADQSRRNENAIEGFRGEVRAATAAQNQTLNDVQNTLSRMEGAQQERDRQNGGGK